MSKLIEWALIWGATKHEGMMDDGGMTYFDAHCIHVFNILKHVTDNEDILCAGILHDTLEDTDTTYDELKEIFNQRVADLVLEVTKEGYNYFPNLKSKDAILIKYADRLSNLSRMQVWPLPKQEKYLIKSKFWKV